MKECSINLQNQGWEDHLKICKSLHHSLDDLIESSANLTQQSVDAICACLVSLAQANVAQLNQHLLDLMLGMLLNYSLHVPMFLHGGSWGGIIREKSEVFKESTINKLAQKMCASSKVKQLKPLFP